MNSPECITSFSKRFVVIAVWHRCRHSRAALCVSSATGGQVERPAELSPEVQQLDRDKSGGAI